MSLARWKIVSEAEALACAGASPQPLSADHVTFAVGGSGTVVIVASGDRLVGSTIWNARSLRLQGPFSPEVRAALENTHNSPLYVFAGLPEGCLGLGTAQVGMLSYTHEPEGGAKEIADASLLFDTALPYEVLDLARPAQPLHLIDFNWIDTLGYDRSAALREFLSAWYGEAESGEDDSRFASPWAPSTLLEFHRLARGRPRVLGTHNRILPLDQLDMDAETELLVFGTECQGDFVWGLRPGGDDPNVQMLGWTDEPLLEREPLSGLLFQFSLFEAAHASPYGGMARLDSDLLRQLTAGLRLVPLSPWRWPSDPTHFYAGAGLIICVATCGEDRFEAWVGARYRAALRPLRELNVEWQRFDG
jgi:hypothetical protein